MTVGRWGNDPNENTTKYYFIGSSFLFLSVSNDLEALRTEEIK